MPEVPFEQKVTPGPTVFKTMMVQIGIQVEWE